MSDRTPSTSFPAGPLSPSSPAAGSLPKENRQLPVSSDHIPQTPTSPPLMSASDQNHVSNFASSQALPNQATIHPPHTSSPPSSTPMSTQVSQQPTMSTTNSFPTPESSVSGHLANATSAEDADHKPFHAGTQDSPRNMGDGSDHQATEHRRTDHDREPSATASAAAGVRDFATGLGQDMDAMDVDTERAPRGDTRNLGLDSLQREFTSAFHLCKSSPIATGPDPSWDLISLYGLGSVAQSVARIDPVTGEKINRLRKSYEGKAKALGLAGKNKPVKQEVAAPGSLRYLSLWPEEEWQNQKVFGKPIKIADMDSALLSLQTSAMQLQPGSVPNNDFWEDVLGHEKPAKTPGSGDIAKKAGPTPSGRSPMQADMPLAASQEPAERGRSSRGRKRHYDDNSFVGYGEGYADDDDDTGFYSNGEGSGKKKRKKVGFHKLFSVIREFRELTVSYQDHVSKVSTPLSERGGSYGVGMFGIGAR
ncbi:uncharacterized protein N7482_003807 [Penicillium canariense]|uniref:Mediator of RNA polymerase II transcription subunit 19 n=1 Tax=Penicillium canariense TaxID=189055 RepID=A0A9W9I7F7_9EURO|nr:uncharacterized protein N7482_003807 [Penicillium canariense]KAJ5168213.1 hypothetical protein N7482_003807 [Penicillium canariense]